MKLYQFEHEKMEFSKDGQLDELIALDRYAIPSYDNYKIGDTVIAIVNKDTEEKKVCTIKAINGEKLDLIDRFGDKHIVEKELTHKPLETKPYQLWERWAKGGASVEKNNKEYWENEFRWLFDGYRYSLGGRIQLMLGQEFVTGKKANLTAYNCFVVRSPGVNIDGNLETFTDVLDVAFKEASIMRRGGGVGLNISNIKTVNGSNRKPSFFKFLLPKTHKDYKELQERIKLGKFKNVEVINELDKVIKNKEYIEPRDSVDGLFESLEEMVKKSYDEDINELVIDFSNIRHRNAIVKGVNGRSSGAVSWMELYVLIANLLQMKKIDNVDFAEIYSHIVHLIVQGGSRRGALMLICENDNENIVKFITRKRNSQYLTGANISVGIKEKFMSNVKKYKNGDTNKVVSDDGKLWDLIIKSAWESAEPGIVFLERYNNESNSWYFSELVATNPCGEQGLPAFGVCNLGHLVLPRFYDEENNDVLWNELERAVKLSVRLQDNIIDYTKYFLKENEDVQLNERRVGIGSMGLGTLLIKLGLRYGSDKADKFIDELYKFIAYHQYKTSIELAKEKGSFTNFDYDKFIQSGFMKRLLNEFPDLKSELKKYGIRNVTLSTQAPTGSTATYIDNIPYFREKFGGVTTGIEPYFSWEYWRAGRLGVTKQTVGLAKNYMESHNLKSIKDLPNHFVTAMDLKPEDHVKVQGTIQKWTDSSISKTANVPNEYTIEETDELYLLGYDLGLKGITVYRDGSRQAQVLATKEEDAKLEKHIEVEELNKIRSNENSNEDKLNNNEIKNENNHFFQKRPRRLYGFTEKIGFTYGDNFGKAYVTINMKDGDVWEVFISTKEKDVSSLAKAMGLMTTKLLRLGCTDDNLQQAIDTLTYDQTMGSLPYGVANILKQIQKEQIKNDKKSNHTSFRECPKCKKSTFDKVNCICHSCGYSSCN